MGLVLACCLVKQIIIVQLYHWPLSSVTEQGCRERISSTNCTCSQTLRLFMHILQTQTSAVSWLWMHHCRMTCSVWNPTQKSNISCRSENHLHQDRWPLILKEVKVLTLCSSHRGGKSRVHLFLSQILCQLRLDSLSWSGSYKLSCWSRMIQQPMTGEFLNFICLFPFTTLGNFF